MYEDDEDDDGRNQAEPRNNYKGSSANGALSSTAPSAAHRTQARNVVTRRPIPGRNTLDEQKAIQTSLPTRPLLGKPPSWEGQDVSMSPTMRERAPSDTATSPFPLNDIDYESSPAAVAQELSNLQALRRMSMDVAAAGDPDLPTLSAAGMPGMAPSASDSEDDSSRLFWVPARLHPELAPQEFKSFLNSKAEQIKRRSGELSSFSSKSSRASSLDSGVGLGGDLGGLSRKKSMLSRQIDNSHGRAADDYRDGADRLERKRSLRGSTSTDPNLEELESLVGDSGAPKRLSYEAGGESGSDTKGDIILPSVPGSSLKRSTRTTYRRGSTKMANERVPYPKRSGRSGSQAASGVASSEPSSVPDLPPIPSLRSDGISKPTQSFVSPTPEPAKVLTNFSRPGGRSPSPPQPAATFESMLVQGDTEAQPNNQAQTQVRQWEAQSAANDKIKGGLPPIRQTVPQIVETPPPPEPSTSYVHPRVVSPPPSNLASSVALPSQSRLPERVSSREDPKTPSSQRPNVPGRQSTPVVAPKPSSRGNSVLPSTQPLQSLDQMSANASPIPGIDTSTSNLSFIPTLTEDKKADNKKTKDKKEEPKKSSWGWLLGKEEGEKEKKAENSNLKPKAKIVKPPEKHDNTRLDLLQSSIDGRGRESVVLDRDSLKLDEERKKESQRKSAGSDPKKEKDGLFSSIFGGGKKHKSEKDGSTKKNANRGLSPEPPYRELKPDIDYNWTRFSILEERAIYRMAHIKLANPRRALYSQVLLSNFMYSYLAKVQQMHPQMNLPTSAKQQQKQQKQQQQPQQPAKDQPDEFTQYQRYQQVSS